MIRMSEKRWDELEWDENRPVEVPVEIHYSSGRIGYAWSPDGRGACYYETLEELQAQHL